MCLFFAFSVISWGFSPELFLLCLSALSLCKSSNFLSLSHFFFLTISLLLFPWFDNWAFTLFFFFLLMFNLYFFLFYYHLHTFYILSSCFASHFFGYNANSLFILCTFFLGSSTSSFPILLISSLPSFFLHSFLPCPLTMPLSLPSSFSLSLTYSLPSLLSSYLPPSLLPSFPPIVVNVLKKTNILGSG